MNFSNQNLIFESINSTTILQLIYYIYLIDTNFLYIKVTNNIFDFIIVFRYIYFEIIFDSDYITVYRVDESTAELIYLFIKLLIEKSTDNLIVNRKTKNKIKYFTENNLIDNWDINKNKTTVILLNITIYSKNPDIIQQICEIIEQFNI